MGKTIEVTVSRSCKVNLGNYESIDFFVSAKAEVDEMVESAEDVTAEVSKTVERAIGMQMYRSYKVRGKDVPPVEVAKRHGLSYVAEVNK